MECFCWDDVPEADMRAVLGDQEYEEELRLETEFAEDMARELGHEPKPLTLDRLYPDDLWRVAGCESGKRYRFTVQVEELP